MQFHRLSCKPRWWRTPQCCDKGETVEDGVATDIDGLAPFPKKRTTLEEAGRTRTEFWGIVPYERISFLRVFLYNLVCISPFIVFFFLWLFPLGFVNDLQSASVPVTLTLTLLTFFWTLFISTLQENQASLANQGWGK